MKFGSMHSNYPIYQYIQDFTSGRMFIGFSDKFDSKWAPAGVFLFTLVWFFHELGKTTTFAIVVVFTTLIAATFIASLFFANLADNLADNLAYNLANLADNLANFADNLADNLANFADNLADRQFHYLADNLADDLANLADNLAVNLYNLADNLDNFIDYLADSQFHYLTGMSSLSTGPSEQESLNSNRKKRKKKKGGKKGKYICTPPNISAPSLASGTQYRCCWYCDRGSDTLPTELLKCAQCGLAEYCNRECQRGDWKLHKAKCKRLTEIVVDTDVKNRLRSGALKRRLDTLGKGTVILTIRDPDITTIGDMNLAEDSIQIEAPFYGCKSLLRVDLQGCTKLTSVGKGAFDECTSLMSVVFPDSLTQLGEYAFVECFSLTSVVLPGSLTQLGTCAFYQCTSLTSVVLPDSLIQIGENAFGDCTSLTSMVFPDSLTQLGEAAFGECTSLTSVVLPDSLTQLGIAAFQNCSSLTSVVFPDSLTQLGESAFADCTSLTSLVLPDSLTQLGDAAFAKCSSLTSVVLPDSLTQLGQEAFAECTSLTSMVLPDSLTQLGHGAFEECTSLTSVVLPDSAELGDEVFDDCDALEQKAASAGFLTVERYLRYRYKSITLRKLVLRLLRKYNQAVNDAYGTEAKKHALALALFPADNSGSLEVGLFLQKMSISGGDGVIGLVGYILEFV